MWGRAWEGFLCCWVQADQQQECMKVWCGAAKHAGYAAMPVLWFLLPSGVSHTYKFVQLSPCASGGSASRLFFFLQFLSICYYSVVAIIIRQCTDPLVSKKDWRNEDLYSMRRDTHIYVYIRPMLRFTCIHVSAFVQLCKCHYRKRWGEVSRKLRHVEPVLALLSCGCCWPSRPSAMLHPHPQLLHVWAIDYSKHAWRYRSSDCKYFRFWGHLGAPRLF